MAVTPVVPFEGEAIFHESEPAERMHFVVAGRVKIAKAAGVREIILEILGIDVFAGIDLGC